MMKKLLKLTCLMLGVWMLSCLAISAQLSVTELFPNPTCEGTSTLARGTGFTVNTTATVDGMAATVTFNTATEIRIDMPNGIQLDDSIAVLITEGGNTVGDSLWVIEVIPTTIDYSKINYCPNDTNPLPILTGIPGGVFSDINATGDLYVNSMTGRVDLAASVPGTYYIGYVTPGLCPEMSRDTIYIREAQSVQLSYGIQPSYTSDTSICFGTELEFTATGGQGYDTYDWYLNDSALKLNATWPFGNLWGEDDMPPGSDTIKVFITNQYGCQGGDEIVFNVIGPPEVEVVNITDPICSEEGVVINLLSLNDNTYINWDMIASDVVVPNNISGQTGTVNAGGVVSIYHPSSVVLWNSADPTQLYFTFRPFSEGCEGITVRDTVTILPCLNSEFFVPGGITPNGDGINDHWNISWGAANDPSEFELEVFNRLGARVYVLPSLDTIWRGEGLTAGAYYYVLISKQSGEEMQKGELVIKRK